MRRIHPTTWQRLRSSSQITRAPLRPLATSIPRLYPRSSPYRPPPPKPLETPDAFEESFDDVGPPPEGPDDPPRPFEHLVTSIEMPQRVTEPLPRDLQTLHHHVLTSFLPANQPLSPPKAETSQRARQKMALPGMFTSIDALKREPTTPGEKVLALVSPFEGGRHYVHDAINRIAAEVDADVLSFDLALGLALDGSASPLGGTGTPAPSLPRAGNPLLDESKKQQSPTSMLPIQPLEEEAEEAEEDEQRNAIVVTPLAGRLPFGPPGVRSEAAVIREDWVQFWDHWLNKPSERQKRIIVLNSVESMAATFDEWWPSLQEAVRIGRSGTEDRRNMLVRPTTVVFASAPSLLRPHTCPPAATAKDREAAAHSIHPMLQEIADHLGGSVETRVENHESSSLWWGSEEADVAGRKQRDARRLTALLDENQGAMALLPSFGKSKPTNRMRHPILDLINANRPEEESTISPVWRALPIIPTERNETRELHERITSRALFNAALVSQAIGDMGAELRNPVEAAHIIRVVGSAGKSSMPRLLRVSDSSDPQLKDILDGRHTRISRTSFQNQVRSATSLRQLAAVAIGKKLSDDGSSVILWQDVLDASRLEAQARTVLAKRIKGLIPQRRITKLNTPDPELAADPVVSALKNSTDLNARERRLLSCVVDKSKLASTTFDQVHLPFKTIDGIRTIVSLPLLFPEAFKGGVLRDHSTTGALLFGPPGTGKTLLARAVANESGARMLAIQPSDVNDKYFGEGEKLVKAVFSLARHLSPCVVFLDEVDALFGARSARGSGSGHKAHDQLLTEFMQEMDGLTSAGTNKDKRVVVIGATNRPFDLDDAVLRRLPRRLLVDLPGPEDRKAILNILLREENLASDVDIERIVRETDGYSGSDLKRGSFGTTSLKADLCVSAALAAVKDSVQVPWHKKTDNETSSSSGAFKRIRSSPGTSTNVVLEQDSSAELATTTPTAGLIHAQLALELPRLPGTESEEETSISTKEQLASEDNDDGEPVPEDSSPSSDEPVQLKRVLVRKHFDTAMSEIRPSSSEEGTLPELRKWAAQFGEGGSERGKKKGFGKGFGFGDANERSSRNEGYGQVGSGD